MSETLFKLAMIAAAAVSSAAASAAAVAAFSAHAPIRAAQVEGPVATPAEDRPAGARGTAIARGRDGHYWADGQVNGQAVRFLVDTGATAVALTPADAERLGFDTGRLRYADRVVTAGGEARAASVRLADVRVAGAELRNVDALVIDKGLDASLLGMTFLGRLSRFEATPGALVLSP